jgi:hypothetical protein
LDARPFSLHVGLQTQNLAIDSQSIKHAAIDDGKHPLNCGTVVVLLGFVALDLFGQRSRICTLLIVIKSGSKLLYASRDGLAHLQGLSPSIAEDQEPTILA